MKEAEFLTLAEILDIHHAQIATYGGDSGMRDLGLLKSAIAMPEAGFGERLLHATLFEMAAAYAFHIAQNQPFLDGNKRTALAAALVFLDLNGVTLSDPHGALYGAMIKMANRKVTKQDLAALLKKLSS